MHTIGPIVVFCMDTTLGFVERGVVSPESIFGLILEDEAAVVGSTMCVVKYERDD